MTINDYLIKYICIVCYLKLILKIKKYRNYWVLINAYWIRLRFVKYRFVRYRFVNRHYLQKKKHYFSFQQYILYAMITEKFNFYCSTTATTCFNHEKKKKFIFHFTSKKTLHFPIKMKFNKTAYQP